MENLETDALGRMPISDKLKMDMSTLLNSIPEGKRGALVSVWDVESETSRTQVAAKLGDDWKVAAGVGFDLKHINSKPSTEVVLIGAW